MKKAKKKHDKTKWQKEAERQAQAMQYELMMYRQNAYPALSRPGPTREKLRYWHIFHETLNGDFALDDPFAYELASRVVSSHPEAGWLHEYMNGNLFHPSTGFGDNIGDVTVGRGNILSNTNAVRQAAETILVQRKIGSAAAKILAKTEWKVKINKFMTLYNAENSMRKAVILRVRIEGMPINVIVSKVGQNIGRIWRRGVSAGAEEIKDMSKLAGLTSKMRSVNGRIGGGILTFAPTVAFDLYDSISHDVHGNLHINGRQFVNSELKNQSGNLVGFAAGELAGFAITTGAALLGVTVGAPVVIVCVLIAGIGAQVIWNKSSAPDNIPQMSSGGGH